MELRVGSLMDPAVKDFLVTLTTAGCTGLVVWVWLLWREHAALDKRVAEFYAKRTELEKIERDIDNILTLVHRLCLKLEVPVVTEPYR